MIGRAGFPGSCGVVRGPLGFSALEAARLVGVDSSLAIALDAGDADSYGGAGQTWSDLSGGGRDYYRGADGTASIDDPMFNGVAGRRSAAEFWSYDGGDMFSPVNANGTFENGHHKDGATRTFLFYLSVATLSATQRVYAGINNALQVGIELAVNTSGEIFLGVGNGTTITGFSSTAAASTDTPFVGLVSYTINGSGFFLVNDTTETFTATVPSPSASNAANGYTIGARPNGGVPLLNGAHQSIFTGFDTALSQADAKALSAMIRQRGLN